MSWKPSFTLWKCIVKDKVQFEMTDNYLQIWTVYNLQILSKLVKFNDF